MKYPRAGVAKPLPGGKKSARQDIFKCPLNFLRIKILLRILQQLTIKLTIKGAEIAVDMF